MIPSFGGPERIALVDLSLRTPATGYATVSVIPRTSQVGESSSP